MSWSPLKETRSPKRDFRYFAGRAARETHQAPSGCSPLSSAVCTSSAGWLGVRPWGLWLPIWLGRGVRWHLLIADICCCLAKGRPSPLGLASFQNTHEQASSLTRHHCRGPSHSPRALDHRRGLHTALLCIPRLLRCLPPCPGAEWGPGSEGTPAGQGQQGAGPDCSPVPSWLLWARL